METVCPGCRFRRQMGGGGGRGGRRVLFQAFLTEALKLGTRTRKHESRGLLQFIIS